jgi:thioredoxin 1
MRHPKRDHDEEMINVLEITSANFDKDVLRSDKLVVVDFWAPWCVPCKTLAPTIEKLSEELRGRVRVSKCNVDDNPDLATDLSILNVPTLVMFKDGKEIGRMVGINSKTAIESRIQELIV